MRIDRYMIFLASCMVAMSLHATGYDDILRQVNANNNELKALASRNSAELYGMKAENTLAGQDLDFSYLFGDKAVGNKWEIGASQSFDWPGVYSARSKAIGASAKAMDSEANARRREIFTETLSLCSRIVWLKKQIALQRSIIDNVNSINAAYAKAFEHGEASVLDVNKLKIEIISARRVLANLEAELADSLADLKLLNGGEDLESGVPDEYPALSLPPSLKDYVATAVACDPEGKALRERNVADAYTAKAARAQQLPSFALGYRHVNELGDKFNGITAGIAIPLYGSRKAEKAAKARVIASEIEASQWQSQVTVLLEKEYEQATKLQAELAMYDSALSGSDTELLRKALDGGQIPLVYYLMELRYYMDAMAQKLEVEYLYSASLTRINRYRY